MSGKGRDGQGHIFLFWFQVVVFGVLPWGPLGWFLSCGFVTLLFSWLGRTAIAFRTEGGDRDPNLVEFCLIVADQVCVLAEGNGFDRKKLIQSLGLVYDFCKDRVTVCEYLVKVRVFPAWLLTENALGILVVLFLSQLVQGSHLGVHEIDWFDLPC